MKHAGRRPRTIFLLRTLCHSDAWLTFVLEDKRHDMLISLANLATLPTREGGEAMCIYFSVVHSCGSRKRDYPCLFLEEQRM